METCKMADSDGVNARGSAAAPVRITEHPLEKPEKTFIQRQEQLEMALIRRSQGIHVPLILRAERKCLTNVGHLPFLFRHKSALNALTGRDELIGFDDFLGHHEDTELMVQPHTVLERSHGFY